MPSPPSEWTVLAATVMKRAVCHAAAAVFPLRLGRVSLDNSGVCTSTIEEANSDLACTNRACIKTLRPNLEMPLRGARTCRCSTTMEHANLTGRRDDEAVVRSAPFFFGHTRPLGGWLGTGGRWADRARRHGDDASWVPRRALHEGCGWQEYPGSVTSVTSFWVCVVLSAVAMVTLDLVVDGRSTRRVRSAHGLAPELVRPLWTKAHAGNASSVHEPSRQKPDQRLTLPSSPRAHRLLWWPECDG